MGKLYHNIIESLNNIKLRDKILILLFLTVVIFVAFISSFTFMKVKSIINDESGEMMLNILDQTNKSINNNINICEVSLNAFYSGGEIESLLTENNKILDDRNSFLRAIKNQIFSFKRLNESVTDLRFFCFNQNIPKDETSVFSASEIENQTWAKKLLEANNQSNAFYWTNAGDSSWNKFNYLTTIYCYKPIFNETDGSPLAILRMDIYSEDIFSLIDTVSFGKNGVAFVAKGNGNLIYYSKESTGKLGDFKSKIAAIVAKGSQEGSFTINIDGINQFLVFNKNNNLGWYIIGDIPQEEINQKANSIRNYIIIIALIICIIALGIAFLFSNLLSKRLKMLSKQISKYSKGDMEIVIAVSGKDEVGQVAYSLHLMLNKITQLQNQEKEELSHKIILQNERHELEMLKKEAELSALQLEINPHFLYNTLETIKGLVFSDDSQNSIIKVTQALADMFRYNLSAGYIVMVKDEISHIENYLMIQNYRFDQVVHLINKIDEKALDNKIIRVTLEPIVENAIKHGFKDLKADHYIVLTSEYISDSLVISVTDDGIGMEKEKLMQIKNYLSTGEYSGFETRKGGLGIYNVNYRIKRHFGAQYGLDIESSIGEGTKVLITLPNS